MGYSIKEIDEIKQKEFQALRDVLFEKGGVVIGYPEQDYIIKRQLSKKIIEEINQKYDIAEINRQRKASWIKGVKLSTVLNHLIQEKMYSEIK